MTYAGYGEARRYSATFQLSPRISGSFRYSILDDYDADGQNRYDRSFDFAYLLLKETQTRPAVSIGLRDFGGTGIYASEYIAATKYILNGRASVTGGLGWGRLGSYNGFTNPLSAISDDFTDRGAGPSSISEVGRLETDQWFRGDAAFFGGIAYQLNDRFSLKAEYSSDAYTAETEQTGFEHKTPFNAALTYGFKNGAEVSAYVLHGSELGLVASMGINPKAPSRIGGIDEAPPALRPRQTRQALSWSDDAAQTNTSPLFNALASQDLTLEGLTIDGKTATVRISNDGYSVRAQALGRAARVLANSLPADIETFQIELAANDLTTSRTQLRRADLEALEYDLEGSWRSFARADIEDAPRSEAQSISGIYPKFNWSIGPYLEPAFFDPDNPIRADLGVEVGASLEPVSGLIFTGIVRQPLLGNLDDSTRESNSVIQHVRTDSTLYAAQSDLAIKQLTAEYFFRPADNLYGRVSAGYFETMFGGASAELLWRPVNSPLALSAEVNYAQQRDFDQLFGFQDYNVLTGHASAYYDFGGGYLGQIDAGRYLAGDYGATFALDREFNNGFKVGAFFTLTDVSFDDFGEGSFDKGIRLEIPSGWLSGVSSKGTYSTTIRPVQRDGGARLDVPNRLFEVTRGSQGLELEDGWGRFWR